MGSELLRFLVDENVPVDIGLFLESAGHDVLIVRRSSLVGSSDRVLSRPQRRSGLLRPI